MSCTWSDQLISCHLSSRNRFAWNHRFTTHLRDEASLPDIKEPEWRINGACFQFRQGAIRAKFLKTLLLCNSSGWVDSRHKGNRRSLALSFRTTTTQMLRLCLEIECINRSALIWA